MDMTREEIVRHYRQAADRKEDIKILAELNCTSRDVIRAILADEGESVPAVGNKLSDQIESLYEAGLSDREIARQLECDKGTVVNWR